MLEIVQFENGRYGLQNQWTGIILPKTFRTAYGADWYRTKLSRRMRKSFAKINKHMSKAQ